MSVMLYGFREREVLLDIFEEITGLRMNHAYIRIGGVIMDLPDVGLTQDRAVPRGDAAAHRRLRALLDENPIWLERNVGVGLLPADDALALGVTGPVLRSAGVPADVRKDAPYCGYETYDFDVPVRTEGDAYARYRLRIEEMRESMKIVRQCLDRLEEPGPVMIEDPKVAWPAKLSVGPDGIGNDPAYVTHIMEESMEALIHHFKMVTQGVEVPAGRGLPGRRVAPRRARLLRRLQRRAPSVPREDPRPLVREPAGDPRDGRGLPRRRRDRRDRVDRSRDGRGGPLMAIFEGERLEEARSIIARYPEGRERSAVMPLLYLAQSVDGQVTRAGAAGGRRA